VLLGDLLHNPQELDVDGSSTSCWREGTSRGAGSAACSGRLGVGLARRRVSGGCRERGQGACCAAGVRAIGMRRARNRRRISDLFVEAGPALVACISGFLISGEVTAF